MDFCDGIERRIEIDLRFIAGVHVVDAIDHDLVELLAHAIHRNMIKRRKTTAALFLGTVGGIDSGNENLKGEEVPAVQLKLADLRRTDDTSSDAALGLHGERRSLYCDLSRRVADFEMRVHCDAATGIELDALRLEALKTFLCDGYRVGCARCLKSLCVIQAGIVGSEYTFFLRRGVGDLDLSVRNSCAAGVCNSSENGSCCSSLSINFSGSRRNGEKHECEQTRSGGLPEQ